jgi:two-component system response regulator FixJ
MKTRTVHLVDDDNPYLQALARMLRASGYQVTLHDCAMEFLGWLPADAEGCVVADVDMPEMDGLSLQAALASRTGALPVVFLTGVGDVPVSVRAMRGGAEDFLLKTAPREDLLAAIDRALARNEREIRERARRDGLHAEFAALSSREREVLGHVVRGRMNKQIAADLGIHERTVKLHRTAIMRKTGLQSAAELAARCQEICLFQTTFPYGQ